jgi:hypothetical protein
MLLLVACEARRPLWARLAPALYLLLCAAAIYRVYQLNLDAGIHGLLLAIGLVPAFVIPVVFTATRVCLAITDAGLLVDGRLEKVDDARLAEADRGQGLLHLTMRSGVTRTFLIASYRDAHQLMAQLPPASYPVGAVAA